MIWPQLLCVSLSSTIRTGEYTNHFGVNQSLKVRTKMSTISLKNISRFTVYQTNNKPQTIYANWS